MNEFPQYIVDAFTDRVFAGNPAAVCILDCWKPDSVLSAIARENNLSETAFLVPEESEYAIRWFTPAVEVDLCGHATLASAYVVLTFLNPKSDLVTFSSKSGVLTVARREELLLLNFPSRQGAIVECPSKLREGLGLTIRETYLARDYLCIVDSEEEVASCQRKKELLQDLPSFGIIVTAPSKTCDFVSRVFFPTDAILEDPVTGSAHCTLIPYWAKRLKKNELHARQISQRGGELFCRDLDERVEIAGRAVLFGMGKIYV